jgi:hypothetical protein
MNRRARLWCAVALMVVVPVLTACGSSAPPTTTTTAPAPTTTLSPSEAAALQPLLLTTADFPAGWREDAQANAADTAGIPSCLADLVAVHGATDRADVVFIGPGEVPAAVIQTVASWSPRAATRSVAVLRSDFYACNGRTIAVGKVDTGVRIRSIPNPATGGRGFTAQMVLTAGKSRSYLDVFYAVVDGHATFVGWQAESPSTVEFLQLTAAALAKL